MIDPSLVVKVASARGGEKKEKKKKRKKIDSSDASRIDFVCRPLPAIDKIFVGH